MGELAYALGAAPDGADLLRRAEQLREAEAILSVIAGNESDILSRHAIDGTILWISPSVTRILGYEPHELIGTNGLQLLDAEASADLAARAPEDFPTGEANIIRYGMRGKDGARHWFESTVQIVHEPHTGEPVETVAIAREITARVLADERARAAAEATVRAYERMTDAFFVLDREWRLTYVNPVAERMQGPIGKRAVGKVLWDEFPDLLGTAWDREYHRAVAEGVPVNILEHYPRMDRWFEATAYPSEDGLSVFFRDVTERKKAEDSLRASERMYAEAYEQERVAAERLRAVDEMKNTFLSAVSHELRTPLTAVVGFAETLSKREASFSEPVRAEMLDRLARAARKLERLLGDLLDLDRLGRGIIEPRKRPTEVLSLVERVLEGSEVEGHPVSIDVEPVVVSVDPAQLERIVENLVVNAARHTVAGTPIWVRAHAALKGLLIAVEDAGAGVTEQERESIFEPFRWGAEAPLHSPGVGIGLSLVRRFAELHGGRAWITEREGGGASFRVFLPGEVTPVAARNATRAGQLSDVSHERADDAVG